MAVDRNSDNGQLPGRAGDTSRHNPSTYAERVDGFEPFLPFRPSKLKMSVRFAAALNQPIDAVADRKDRKACASDGTGCAVGITAAAIADTGAAQSQRECREKWQRKNR